MFGFLKRLFGGSAAVSPPPADQAPSAPPAPPRPAPRPEISPSGDETIIYRRQPTSSHGSRHLAPAPTDADICLVVLVGSRKGAHVPVPSQGLTIGRNQACDLVLADQHVSSKHAWVGMVDGIAVIRDLASTNGTFLNASSENVADDTPLAIGDTIMLGGHYGVQLRVLRAEAAAGAPGD